MIKPQSNIHVLKMVTPAQIAEMVEDTDFMDFTVDGKKMLVDVNEMLSHVEFCGAAEYFNNPKGAA